MLAKHISESIIDIQEKLDLDKHLQVYYHKDCVSKYLPSHADDPIAKCRRRSDRPALNFRKHCSYCDKIRWIEIDKKNPNRWVSAYLAKEVETHQVNDKGNQSR